MAKDDVIVFSGTIEDKLPNTMFRVKLEKAGKSPQTVKHVLTLVKRLLNFALRKGYVESIPGTLHITMPTVDNKVTENLTPAQAQKLLQALDEEQDQVQASLVRLALFTGMRRGALLNLQWSDLDFIRGFITLRGDVAKKQKTETIPMNEQARAMNRAVSGGGFTEDADKSAFDEM